MNKDFRLRKEDIVTYKTKMGNEAIYIIGNFYDNKPISSFEKDGYKVLIVKRRSDYYIAWEKKEILDKKEKEYLSAVIKPFRDKVTSVVKSAWKNEEYIVIKMLCGENDLFFPSFKKNTMYNGMELNEEYTLEELGL